MVVEVGEIEDAHRQYAGIVYDACFRLLNDRAEAEDAVQETFISAFRGWGTFRGGSLIAWLYRIATNECLQMLRTRRRKGPIMTDALDCYPSDAVEPGRAFDARRLVNRLLQSADGRDVEIVVSHYLYGMDQGEIAASLGISRRAVVKRLTRIRIDYGHLVTEME